MACKDKSNATGHWVLKFFKENVAFLTIVPILTSALLCLMAYFFQSIELQSWNVPVEVMGPVNGGRYFYIVVSGLLFYFATTLLPLYLYPRTEKGMFLIKLQLFLWSSFRMARRIARKTQRHKVEYKLSECMSKCWQLQKNTTKQIWPTVKYGLCYFLPFSIMYYVFMGFAVDFGSVILTCVLSSAVVVALLFMYSGKRSLGELEKLKGMRRAIKDDFENIICVCEMTIGLMRKVENEKPLKLSQEETFRCIKSSLFLSVLMFFGTMLTNCFLLQYKHEFWIYDNNGQDYAVVYGDNNRIVIERATIDDDKITIDLDRQESIERVGAELRHMTFKTVTRVHDRSE